MSARGFGVGARLKVASPMLPGYWGTVEVVNVRVEVIGDEPWTWVRIRFDADGETREQELSAQALLAQLA